MRWVVYVYADREMREVFLRDPRGQTRDVIALVRGHQQRVEVEDNENEKYVAFACDEEQSAIQAAEQLVRMCPGADVLVAQVKFMVSATAPNIVRKQVTEKGVLPA